MTRLTDADICIEKIKNLSIEYDAETVQRCIEVLSNAPTIDAIPIEWIMRYAFDGERKHPISITEMIAEWRKEHAETDLCG